MASKPKKSLEKWEIALIKLMISEKRWNDQDILAYFTRPTRSINHARILEIRNGSKHAPSKPHPQKNWRPSSSIGPILTRPQG